MTSPPALSSQELPLKRQPRARPRRSAPESLHIIPEVSEDEGSVSSCSSGQCSTSKHQRRRAQITPADIPLVQNVVDSCASPNATYNDFLSFSIPPRPAPVPPSPTSSTHSESFSVWLEDMDYPLRFPRTPSHTPVFPRSDCSSPTPSLTDCSSPEARVAGLPVTPVTSDDEHTATIACRRVSIKPLVIVKNKSRSLEPEEDSEVEDESEWYARELGQVITLHSPLPTPVSLQPARADSLTRRRSSKTMSRRSNTLAPPRSGPSKLLDPTFPRRRSVKVPKRPPPPPPLFQTARPLPRVSVPADFDFDIELSQDIERCPDVPIDASIFSPMVNDLGFEFDVEIEDPLRLSLPSHSLDLEGEIASTLQALSLGDGHELRSRWSSSTLSTLREQDASVTAKLIHYFSGSSPKRGHKSSKSQSSTITLSPPPSPPPKGSSRTSTPEPKKRRGSGRYSPTNSDSGCESSRSSSGLRRKPIPIEMFLRASHS